MTLKNAAGTAIPLSSMPVTASAGFTDTRDGFYTVDSDVYEEFLLPGTTNTYGKRLLFTANQRIQKSEYLAAFPPATITSLSPTGGDTSAGQAVTIVGTHLRGTTGVTFGGAAATSVVVVDDQTVTCVAPAHAAGVVDVVLTDDSGTVTSTGGYTYTAGLATVTGISPATGDAGGGTAVTLTGTKLYGVTAVTFGGSAATSVVVVSATSVTCVTPAHAAGAVTVVVTDDGGAITKTTFFTYT